MPEPHHDHTDEITLHFSDYWRIVKNRWPIILTIFILVVGTAWFYGKSLPKIYSSYTTIGIDKEGREKNIFNIHETDRGVEPFFLQTEFEIIKSKTVLNPVIEQLHLKKVIAERTHIDNLTDDQVYQIFLRQYLNVQPFRSTKLIEITVESPDSAQAAEIANTIAAQYEKCRKDDIQKKVDNAVEPFKENVAEQGKVVAELTAKVDEIRRERVKRLGPNAVIATASYIPGNATLLDMQIQTAEAKVASAKTEVTIKVGLYNKIKTLSLPELENILPSLGKEDSNLSSLRQNYLALQSLIVSLQQQGLGEEHTQIKSARASLQETRKQLNAALEGTREGIKTDAELAEKNLAAMEDELLGYKDKRQQTDTDDSLAELEKAQRELDSQQQILNMLKARYQQEVIDNQIQVIPVRVYNKAEPNPRPVKPKLTLIMGGAVGVGLFLGISLAFFIEYLDTSIKSLDDVERYLKAPVVGIIPDDVEPLINEGADSPNGEAYRILRAKIDFKGKEDGATTLTIVSGGPGEGKSTTIFNLAYVCAYSGINTLLVDVDFRRHSLDRILNIENTPGLADYLIGNAALSDCIRATEIPNLHIIASGKLPPHCMGALSPTKMAEIVATLKPYYEVILFDAPPILGISDAAVIVHEVDMTLLVVQHRRYPRHISLRAKNAITEMQGRFAGVVLNKVQLRSDDSYYYYTAYYGYEDGYNKTSKKKLRKARKQIKQNKKSGVETSGSTDSGAEQY
ncbi:MAG: polysaccharide biosynthesis tyrosine autokinase [Verrucomicrobiales bacterium]|jgi:capsular exopolysaccharide synthesis family protein|nr:polysaccharide biosynthesis tyrosine autokinase [Verrucomicrobiales bacterium]